MSWSSERYGSPEGTQFYPLIVSQNQVKIVEKNVIVPVSFFQIKKKLNVLLYKSGAKLTIKHTWNHRLIVYRKRWVKEKLSIAWCNVIDRRFSIYLKTNLHNKMCLLFFLLESNWLAVESLSNILSFLFRISFWKTKKCYTEFLTLIRKESLFCIKKTSYNFCSSWFYI